MLQNDLLYAEIVASSAISLVGCGFIIVMYHRFSSLQIFAFKLVYILTLFDILISIFAMIPTQLSPSKSGALCKIQGAIIEFASLAGILWTGGIALILYMQVVLQKSQIHVQCNALLSTILIISIVFSVVPLIFDDYRYVGGWCWITDQSSIGLVFRYTFLYIWVWIVIVFDIYAYLKIIHKIKATMTINNSFLHQGKTLVRRLRWYPFILAVCYSPLTIMRVVQTVEQDPPEWLVIFSTALASLLGFFNAIVYGCNNTVKEQVRSWISGVELSDPEAMFQDSTSGRLYDLSDSSGTRVY